MHKFREYQKGGLFMPSVLEREQAKRLDKRWKNCTVSFGTLIEADIFKAIKDRGLIPDYMVEEYETAENAEHKSYYFNEVIYTYLDSIAPEGCYWGNTEGDGSDFGFWSWGEEEK
jgi:hypothetical protein